MSEQKRFKIKDLAIDDRPREKLMEKGIASLSDAELLAILIGSGSRNESAVELCRRILNDNQNNLNELARITVNDLSSTYDGIGNAKAISIVAALELGRRRNFSLAIKRDRIGGSSDAYSYFQPLVGDLNHEEFWMVFLNQRNKIIKRERISMGGIAGTVIDVRLIMKMAVMQLSTGIIFCHNHPSGEVDPSNKDIQITRKLSEAGKVLDIRVLDHIIIAGENYFSFADEGLI